MLDLISIFIGYGIVALIILAVIAVIPKWVILSTESENDPDHIYSIFMEESGYRGHKVLSAAGCLFPFILLTKTSHDIEGVALGLLIGIGCFFYHSTVYKGYPVFNQRMKILLLALAGVSILLSLLARYSYLSTGVYSFILMSLGVLWGGYAVYKRSILIRITRRSSKDAVNGAA
jgi:hypothetical protein